MKYRINRLTCVLIAAIQLSGIAQVSPAQGSVSFGAGLGIPEMINIGFKTQVADQVKAGISLGWWPAIKMIDYKQGPVFAFSGDLYYHFAGSSAFSEMHPWYAMIGATYFRVLHEAPEIPVYLRIGRKIYFNRRNGIMVDFGGGYVLNNEDEWTNALIPCGDISYFHRFGK